MWLSAAVCVYAGVVCVSVLCGAAGPLALDALDALFYATQSDKHPHSFASPASALLPHLLCPTTTAHHCRITASPQFFMATGKDDYRKPGRGMWDLFVQHANKGVQPDLE